MNILIITNLCLGITRPISPTFCPDCNQTIESIIRESKKYEICYIVNDSHNESDIENNYLQVPHLRANSTDCNRLSHIEERLQSKYLLFDIKNTMSAAQSEHRKKIIEGYTPEIIAVAGFTTCYDVVPTAIDLSQIYPEVFISEVCTDDISVQAKQKGLDYAKHLGIRTL